jgi:hypothetical protein
MCGSRDLPMAFKIANASWEGIVDTCACLGIILMNFQIAHACGDILAS